MMTERCEEQAVYVDSLGCEHLTLPSPRGSHWPPETDDGRQPLRLIRVEHADSGS